MEIPYIFTPRKDTGLVNSKIAIWLFLASEVMLFGGFFSAYIFLRLGADYPWPERTLPVLPGLINTFVLIASSVTVVFAWVSLKMRKWRHFQVYMAFTCLCALIFMALKGIEYNVKFHHQAVRLKDYAVVEGHLGYELKDGVHVEHGHEPKEEDYALNHHGKKFEENVINFETTQVTFDSVRFHTDWVEEMIGHAAERKATITLTSSLVFGVREKGYKDEEGKAHPGAEDFRATIDALGKDAPLPELPKGTIAIRKGTELSVDLLNQVYKLHQKALAENGELRTDELRRLWKEVKAANPGVGDHQLSEKVAVKGDHLPLLAAYPSIAFKVEPPVTFHFAPRDIQEGAAASTLRDGTALAGKLLESPMSFHYVDAIDFRHLAMKAEDKQIDPKIAIENSWLLKENPELKEIWEKQQKALGQLTDELAKKHKVPTEKDKYRINWQEMAYYMTTDLKDVAIKPGKYQMPSLPLAFKEEFFGPDYHTRAETPHPDGHDKGSFPHLVIPREQVAFASKFAPAWNTYYAIYFTMTGLHGLHVIGGALVLAYYLFFGKKMYLSNPEWLANRVEVGGLFWHFVDLVWIFLFPILYLM